MDDLIRVIGMPVALETEPVAIAEIRLCVECTAPTYLSYSTVADLGDRGFEVICLPCFIDAISQGQAVEILPPGLATQAEVMRAAMGRSNDR